MQVYNRLSQPILERPTSLTIGNFDGVHLGHQQLIRCVVASARVFGRQSALVTFSPHPRVVSGRGEEMLYLNTNQEKLKLFQQLGLDIVVQVEFTPETMQLHAAQFVDLLLRNLGMRQIWVGHDFSFGYQRQGNLEMLQQLSQERGFTFHRIAPPGCMVCRSAAAASGMHWSSGTWPRQTPAWVDLSRSAAW
jgi:riboflavin kinase/FMN adenylyltransferase